MLQLSVKIIVSDPMLPKWPLTAATVAVAAMGQPPGWAAGFEDSFHSGLCNYIVALCFVAQKVLLRQYTVKEAAVKQWITFLERHCLIIWVIGSTKI